MKSALLHGSKYGTASMLVNSKMLRFSYHPGAHDGSTSFLWNGVEYTGTVTMRLKDGVWAPDDDYRSRDISFSRTDYKYSSYDANQMSSKNQNKVALVFAEMAKECADKNPEWFKEALEKETRDKITSLQRALIKNLEDQKKLEDEYTKLLVEYNSLRETLRGTN